MAVSVIDWKRARMEREAFAIILEKEDRGIARTG